MFLEKSIFLNEANWNILVASGIKIKWDSLNNKLEKKFKSKMNTKFCLKLGKPFPKAKYNI